MKKCYGQLISFVLLGGIAVPISSLEAGRVLTKKSKQSKQSKQEDVENDGRNVNNNRVSGNATPMRRSPAGENLNKSVLAQQMFDKIKRQQVDGEKQKEILQRVKQDLETIRGQGK